MSAPEEETAHRSTNAPYPREVVLLSTNVHGIAVLAAAFISTLSAIEVVHRLGPGPLIELAPFAPMAALVVTLIYLVLRAPLRYRRVPFEITSSTVRVGTTSIARADIENAYVRPEGEGAQRTSLPRELRFPQVVITGRGRANSVLVAVESEEEARSLVEALALDPSKTVSTFRVRGGFAESRAVDQALMFIGMLSWWSLSLTHWSPIVPSLLVAIAALNVFWPKRVRIGADGVYVTSPGRRKYFPLSAVDAVEETITGLVLVLSSGERAAIQTNRFTSDDARVQKRAIIERSRAAILAGRDVLLVLDRGSLSTREWLAKVRTLSSRSEYRVSAPKRDDLWRVLEDATAKPEIRVAAAAALRVGNDEGEKTRLRIAGEATASPELRVALEAAADGNDAAIERALSGLGIGGD